MTKHKFILELQKALSGLPKENAAERISFYAEMIDDRVEDGLSEEEAVAAVGSVDEIASQIISEYPLARLVKTKIKPKRRLSAFEIVLIIVGSPLWFSLLAAAVAAVFSVYVSLWSVIISLWASFASVAATAFAGLLAGGVLAFTAFPAVGVASVAAALVLSGLSILFFFGCRAATGGMVLLSKKLWLCIKKVFMRKEAAV